MRCNIPEKIKLGIHHKKTYYILMVTFLVLIIVFFNKNSTAKTIIVSKDGNGEFEKIQDAINISKNNDIIYVYSGVYHENIIINKSINLIGNGSKFSIIDFNILILSLNQNPSK